MLSPFLHESRIMWKLNLLMTIVLALSVAAFVVDADDITNDRSVGWVARSRPKDCAKGSSVWCKDLRSAKKCGAVKYCIQVKWERMKLDPDPSNVCETCKEMVQEARDVLQSNSTQELLAAVLEGTCQIYFPIKILARECVKYVDEFIPEFVDILASRMDPQAVCSIAWLCNSDKLEHLIEDARLVEANNKVKTSDVCQDCKNFMIDIINQVKTEGKLERKGSLESSLDQACNELKGLAASICKKAVSEHIDDIYKYVITMQPGDACKLAAMCIDGVDKVFKNAPPILIQLAQVNSGDTECDFCVQLVTRLKETITTNSTKAEIKQTLLSICTQLKSYSDKCTVYVNDYFEEIYEFLVDEMNPPVVCKAIGLCKQDFKFLPGRKEISSNSKMHLTGTDESNSINWKPKSSALKVDDVLAEDVVIQTPVSKKQSFNQQKVAVPSGKNCDVQSGPTCALCEYALHQLQQILVENVTQEQIKEAIDKVCDLMPASLSDQCTKFVDQYGDQILAMLAQEIDPTIVCTELGICASKKIEVVINTPVIQPQVTQRKKPEFTIKKSSTCILCEFFASQLDKMLLKNATKDEIKNAVEMACSFLPRRVSDECNQFVDKYADTIIEILAETLEPSILCSALGVCSAVSTASLPPVVLSATAQRQLPLGRMFPGATKQMAGKESCLYCQYAMQLIHTILNTNGTMDEIVLGLDNLCHQMPNPWTDRCDSMVESYAEIVLKALSSTDLTQVCRLLSFCQGSVAETLHGNVVLAATAAVEHANGDNCEICEATVEIVDKLLDDSRISTGIVQVAEQVCGLVPTDNRPKCKSFIDVYGPYLIQTIGELAKPKEVCQIIRLCPPDSRKKPGRLLGGDKCTFGPAYWCKSKIHAKACKAEKHCRDFVWKN